MPRFLLTLVASPPFRDYVLGDLDEEFSIRAVESAPAARAWYWRQVLKSMPPLMRTAVAHSDWQITFALVFIAAAGDTVVFDRFWSAVVSYVPLKVDLVRDSTYVIAHLSLAFVFASIAGTTCSLRSLPAALAAASLLTGLGMAAMHGITPSHFAALQFCTVAAGMLFGTLVRRFTSRPGDFI